MWKNTEYGERLPLSINEAPLISTNVILTCGSKDEFNLIDISWIPNVSLNDPRLSLVPLINPSKPPMSVHEVPNCPSFSSGVSFGTTKPISYLPCCSLAVSSTIELLPGIYTSRLTYVTKSSGGVIAETPLPSPSPNPRYLAISSLGSINFIFPIS